MKLPRVRFTVRLLAVAVAAGAVVSYGWLVVPRTRAQREWLAEYHYHRTRSLMKQAEPGSDEIRDPAIRAKLRWHEQLRAKYERAARHPWLPVAPDPPEPK